MAKQMVDGPAIKVSGDAAQLNKELDKVESRLGKFGKNVDKEDNKVRNFARFDIGNSVPGLRVFQRSLMEIPDGAALVAAALTGVGTVLATAFMKANEQLEKAKDNADSLFATLMQGRDSVPDLMESARQQDIAAASERLTAARREVQRGQQSFLGSAWQEITSWVTGRGAGAHQRFRREVVLAEQQLRALLAGLPGAAEGALQGLLNDPQLQQLNAAAAAAAENTRRLNEEMAQLDQFAAAVEARFADARRMIEDARTPLEKYADEIDRLNEMWAMGAFGDDADALARQILRVEDALIAASGARERWQNPVGEEVGSREALNAIQRIRLQNDQAGGAREERLQAAIDRQTQIEERMAAELARIRQRLDQQGPVPARIGG